MKQNISVLSRVVFLFTAALIFTSCGDDNSTEIANQADVESETSVEAYFEDVDDLSNSVSNFSDASFSGRSVGLDDRLCAEAALFLLHENPNDPDTIRIDFGTMGCTDPKGNTRKGAISMIFTGDRKAGFSVVFDGFYLNGVLMEGTRQVTRTTFLPPTFNFTLENGKATWPDGTFATRTASGTRVFYRTVSDPSLDSMVLKSGGTASGRTRKGNDYTMSISKDIVFKRSCMESPKRIFIPVSGTKNVTVGSKNMIIDFGEGACDKIATVTVDGVSKEITLNRD